MRHYILIAIMSLVFGNSFVADVNAGMFDKIKKGIESTVEQVKEKVGEKSEEATEQEEEKKIDKKLGEVCSQKES